METRGRTGRWKERLRGIDAKAAAQTDDILLHARVDELQKIRKLIDASFIAYAERLREGMRMTPADLERLNRLSLALIEEITQPRINSQADDGRQFQERTPEHTAAVVDALAETGALEALGLTRVTPTGNNEHSTAEGEER